MAKRITGVITFNAPLESIEDLKSWLRNSRFTGEFYHRVNRNADGTPQRWRVNGQLKLWKRSPDRMHLPLAQGLYRKNSVDSIEEFNNLLSTGYTVSE